MRRDAAPASRSDLARACRVGTRPFVTGSAVEGIATMKDSFEQTEILVAHAAWIERRINSYVQYVNPAFHAFDDDR